MKIGWIIVAAAALSFGQTPSKKETPPATKKATAPAAPDSWERSRECADQAEKVMKGKSVGTWENHYSPKYNKCFIEYTLRVPGEGAGKDYPELTVELIDAFERTHLAKWFSETSKPGTPPRDDGVANTMECQIAYMRVDCAKAIGFTVEHMRN